MNSLKGLTALLILLITLVTSQTSFGQESENQNQDSKFGLGVSLFSFTEYMYEYDYDLSNSIYFTMDVGDKLRIEPKIGFAIAEGYEQFSFGIGVFGKKPISKFDLIYGLRLGMNSNETKIIAPTIGGEYYFVKNFSIGSEVQLRGLIINKHWAVLTYSSVIIRFYLLKD